MNKRIMYWVLSFTFFSQISMAVSIDLSVGPIDRPFQSIDHVANGAVIFSGSVIDFNPATVLFGDTFVETTTGREGIVGMLNSNKQLLWHKKYPNSGDWLLATANSNTVFVYNEDQGEIELLDLSGNAKTQMVAQIETVVELVDSTDKFYLVCYIRTGDDGLIGSQVIGSPAGNQIVVICFDNDGNIEWINEDNVFTESINTLDFSAFVAPDGSLGVSGSFTQSFSRNGQVYNSSGSSDIFVFQYLTDGSNGFTSTMGGANYQYAEAIAIGSTGAYYITGRFTNSAEIGPFNFTTHQYTCPIIIKIDPQGNVVAAEIPNIWPSNGEGSELCAHWDSQSIYWIGQYAGTMTYDGIQLSYGRPYDEVFIYKLNEDLSAEWGNGTIYGTAGELYDSTVDDNGAVYIAGRLDSGLFGQLVKLENDPTIDNPINDQHFTIESKLAQSVIWQTQAPYYYQPQYSYDLEVWTDIGGQVQGDNSKHTVYFTPDEDAVFYRVVRYD